MGIYCSLYCEGDGDVSVHLERRWDMLDYLLTRARSASADDPAAFLSFEGWEDVAGEAHRIPSQCVKAIADWFDQISCTDLMLAFAPDAMVRAKVYDADLVVADPDFYRDVLARDIDGLRNFFGAVRRTGDNVIRAIS